MNVLKISSLVSGAANLLAHAGKTLLPALVLGSGLAAATAGQGYAQAFSTTSAISDADGGQLIAGDQLILNVNFWDSDATYDFSDVAYSVDFSTADSGIIVDSVTFSPYCTDATRGFSEQPGPQVDVYNLAPFAINNQNFGCFVNFTFTLPDDIAPGTYTVDVSDATGTAIDGSLVETPHSQAMNDASFTVVADTVGPTPVIYTPGDDLPDEPFDISIQWGETVQNFVSGDISVTNGSVTSFDPVVGEAGGSDAANFNVTITPSGPGTVTIEVPAGVADDLAGNANTDTDSASVEILTLASMTLQVLTNPVDAGDGFSFRFTVTNDNLSASLSSGALSMTASETLSGLTMSLASTPAEPCGTGSGAVLTNSNGTLTVTGMALAAGASCTFDVDATVPGGAASGNYNFGFNSWSYSLDGNPVTGSAVGATLQVSGTEGGGAPLVFSKTFSEASVSPGSTIDVEYQIVPAEGSDLSSATFTDDFDAALSGLAITGDLPSAPCGTGSSLSGTSTLTLTGGNLADGESCTFSVTLTVPSGASGGTVTSTTSDLTGFADDGGGAASFTESGASDSFQVNVVALTNTLSTDATSPGVGEAFEVTLRFSKAVTGLDLSDFSVANVVLSNLAPVAGEFAYTFDATPQATGALSIFLPQDSVVDDSLNGNPLSNTISLTAVSATPEIDITGLGVAIPDGTTVPDLNNGTNFGSVGTSGSTKVRTFVITNSGTGTLTFTGGTPITLSGTDASEFTVVSQPSTLAPGATFDLQISYDPSTSAEHNATVSIASDDADEDPYTFVIRGTGAAGPEITVSGNSIDIADGDVTATTTDHTDFGSIDLGSSQVRTFTITNDGDGTLTLGANAVSLDQTESQFAVTSQPATTLAPSATTTFSITYTPTTVGARAATVNVASDDADENPYNFAIAATGTGGVEVNLTGNSIDIADGDTVPASADGTDFGSLNVGDTVTQTFIIQNSGTTTLTLSPAPIEVSGQSVGSTIVDVFGSSDFSITSQPSTSIAAGTTSSFVVSYTPSSTGTVAATTIAFGTDDPDEQRYEFAVTGFATAPEIAVTGEGNDIPDGDTTPVATDGTLFGSYDEDSGSEAQTFTITNSGDGLMTLGSDAVSVSGTNAADFTVTAQPATTVAASGGTTTFEITFDPSGTGSRTATISIANDDLDEAPFTFAVEGEGLDVTAPAAFTVAFDDDPIGSAEASSTSFTFSGAEVGTTYDYSISSSGGGTAVTDTGTISSAGQTISGIDVSGLGDGTLTLSVTLEDASTNSTGPVTDTVSLDQTAPTVTISGPSASQNGAFTATFTFSEDVTGFALGNISVGNGSASSLAGSGDTYTATITPAADGTVTVDMAADVATDGSGNGNAAASQFSVEADLTVPTVAITGPSATQTGAFTATVTFSEDVSGFAIGNISAGNATLANFSTVSAQVYTVTVTPSADGSVTLDVAADAATDGSGNGNTAATQFSVEADVTAPTVAITGPSAAQTGAFTAIFTFSEDVTGFALGNISVGNGSAASLAGSGDTYTATITPSADGTVTVDVAADAATDAAGNGNTAATQFSVEADITAPTLAITGPSATQTGAFSATFTFSEDVTGFALADISVGNGSASSLAGSGDTYTATITPTADGSVTIDVAADAASDAAGNGNTVATQFSVQADISAPTLTITGPSTAQTGAFTATFTFSESVTGFALADISVGNGTASSLAGTGDTYTATITPSADGAVTVDVAADVAEDAAGNLNTAAVQFSVDADITAPTLAITGPSATQTGAFTATFTFSEDVTGFALGDISVGNGTASSLSGSGDIYTATITPAADGTVTVDVAADAASDDLGNGNTAAAQFSVGADITLPTLVISGPSATQTGAFTATVTFSEDVTGFALADMSVGNGSASSLAGSGDTYTATITPAADGSVTIDVAADAASDAAGNGNTVATQFSVEADVTAPDVTITGPSAALNAAFTATFTFSEDVTGFALADISVGNGSASAFAGSGDSYTATITPTSDGAVTVDVAADVAADAAGNGNTVATQFSVDADLTAPTVAITGPSDVQTGAFTATFTFSEDVTGFALADITVGNGAASDLAGSGDTYTATITPAADGAVTVDVAVDVATDATGNGNAAATQFSVDADISAPTANTLNMSDLDLRLTDVGTSVTIAIGFSEAMDTAETPEFSFDPGIADTLTFESGAWSNGDTTFTATFTVSDEGVGASDVDVTVSGAVDAAGNTSPDATFTDVFSVEMRRGSIEVVETIDGAIDGSFAFTGDLGAFTVDTSAQTGSEFFDDLSEGSYSFAVAELEGFTLQDIVCTGGTTSIDVASGSVAVTLGPTDAVSCDFQTLADPDIDETTIPEVAIELPVGTDDPTTETVAFSLDNVGGEDFFFTATTDVDWLLIDPTSGSIPAEGSLEFTIEFTDAVLDLEPGTYTATITITETSGGVPNKDYASAPTLSTINIPVTVTLEPREGNLTIVATTAPMEAGDGQFNYTSTLDGLDGLSLATSGGTASSSTLTIERGSYDLTQLASEGWDLASISCVGDTDGGSVVDLDTGTVTIDLDAEEDITCTFANRRNEEFIRAITLSAIRSFMAARADLILTNGPDVSSRMRGDRAGATPTRFAADFRDGRFNADLSTSLSAIRQAAEANAPQTPGHDRFSLAGQTGLQSLDVWMQASFSSINDNRAGLNSDTDFGLYYLGVDAMASENMLVGVLFQFDHAATTTGEWRSRVEGDGWMVGPYMVARLGEAAYFDARAAWGRSDNTVNPIGLYTDAFETDRWLLEAHLIGDITRGNWRISPEIGLAYFSETQDAYTDTLGIYIPSQDLTIGRLNVGPEIAYRFEREGGAYIEPYVHLNVVYDYDDADVFNLSGQLQSLGFMRGDARLGINAELGNGGLISGEVSILGLGEGEFEANSAMIRVRLPLSLH